MSVRSYQGVQFRTCKFEWASLGVAQLSYKFKESRSICETRGSGWKNLLFGIYVALGVFDLSVHGYMIDDKIIALYQIVIQRLCRALRRDTIFGPHVAEANPLTL